MKLTHVTLAIVSGTMLVLLVGVVYVANKSVESPSSQATPVSGTASSVFQNNSDTPVENIRENKNAEEPLQGTTLPRGAVLDVHGQNLQKVPDYVFQRLDIQELNLSDNALTGSLQAEVRLLRELRILNLSNNKFTGVPAEVGQLTELEVLDLSNNELTGLPQEIGNLQNLQVLDLRGNAYAKADLDIIRTRLPKDTRVLVD